MKEFEPGLKNDLIACGFEQEKVVPDVDRMVRRIGKRVFSAVPWITREFGYERPTIWLAELTYRYDTYASCQTDIEAFINRFTP